MKELRILPQSALDFLDDLETRAKQLSLEADSIADLCFTEGSGFEAMKAKRIALLKIKETIDMDIDGAIKVFEEIRKKVNQIEEMNKHLCVLFATMFPRTEDFIDYEIGRYGVNTESFFGE